MTLLMALGIILLAFLGSPLFIIAGLITFLGFYFSDTPIANIIGELYRMANAPGLLAIPLFTFAGTILAEGKTPQRLVNLSNALFGWLPGGTAIVTIVSCAFFTAFTGASGVTIIALGGLIHPILLKEKYPEQFSLGLLTSCGSLGLLFPPSLPLILYGLVADTSVDRLFMAGILPGFLMLALMSVYSIRVGSKTTREKIPFSFSSLFNALKAAVWEIPLPIIILGGIYGGVFTATEAGAITAFYVLVIEVFVYRELSLFRDIPRIMKESMILVGGILIVLGCALGLTSYLIDAQVPMKLFESIQIYIQSKFAFLLLLNIFLLIVGCMLDIFSAIIVVVPLIIPISNHFGIDPVHLGIIFLANLQIGYITPPVGLSLFISSLYFNKPVIWLAKSSLPFFIILVLVLIVITYIPEFSLFLANMFNPAAF